MTAACVIPSAIPRNSENVPSVTMSGGILEVRDEHGVERAAGAANEQRDERRERWMESPIAARGAKDHRRESHHRADRQVDSAGDDDRRERDGQQPDFYAQPRDFEEVPGGREVRRDRREKRDLDCQRDEQDGVAGTSGSRGPSWRW